MKYWLLCVIVLVSSTFPANAQIAVRVSGARPVVQADVGGIAVSARLGARGLDVRVSERGGTPARADRRPTVSARRGAAATASSVLATADSYKGTQYVWGGEAPSGFDCSGFVQYVFARHGVDLPRTSRQQAVVGQYVAPTLAAVRPGDLMLFATRGGTIDHIAIYAGGNRMIHSSASGGGVVYDEFSSRRGKWFVAHHIATRRVLADGRNLVGPLSAALRAIVEFDPPDTGPRSRIRNSGLPQTR